MIIFPLFFFLARAAAHNKVLSDLQSVRVNDGVDAPPFLLPSPPPVLVLSDAQRGRVFEGVGGISGGGATSRLLEDYPDAKVSALYDALFSPQAAAAFQVVKVEIPADSDTTCGSEQAHRHDKADGGSCTRGYEGSFLAAANARRPGIAAHSLQWAAPAFVGEVDVDGGKSLFTRTNAVDYVLPWLECMRESYNVTIAWQGAGWNEKPHNNTYARLLRNVLDTNSFSSTGLASADQCCGAQWNIVENIVADPTLLDAIGAITVHCGGSLNKFDTPDSAVALGIPLFQGEEHIGLPDPDSIPVWMWPAAAATGVEINQNWVLSNLSATIFWPAAYAWLSGLDYQGKGFVVATSPWGDAPCYIPTALWVVAHTTHFTSAGVSYLLNGTGSGHIGDARANLGHGGWNVSYVGYATGEDVTLVVESFLAGGQWHAAAGGGGGGGPTGDPPTTSATFQLAGGFSRLAGSHLSVWHTNASSTFQRLADAPVAADGTFTVSIEPGAIYTYTSVPSSHPGGEQWLKASAAAGGCTAAPVMAPGDLWPPEAPFPLPFYDDFEGYNNDTLPLYASDMFGAFSVYLLPTTTTSSSSGGGGGDNHGGGGGASTHPKPLRYREGISAGDVACGDAAAAAVRPRRCRPPSGATTPQNNTRVLRQWTRSPPLGWGSSSSNMATILGNGTLGNVTLSVRAMIETPEAGYAPSAPPYVEFGLNGGSNRKSGPGAFYGNTLNADSLWFNASHWGCSIACRPAVCAEAHPVAFGLDVWHAVSFGEFPAAGGASARWMVATLDGVELFNLTASSPVKNNGEGGFLVLRTGAHRVQFDDLSITSNS